MLLNSKGQKVPATSYNVADITVREVKDVDNHRCHDMFRLSTRVTFKGSQKKGWVNAQILG